MPDTTNRNRIEDFTADELNLYYDIQHAHTVGDVLSQCGCSVEDADAIAEHARNLISKSDCYFDAYWFCVDEAIEEVMPKKDN